VHRGGGQAQPHEAGRRMMTSLAALRLTTAAWGGPTGDIQ
jgi:hypothetical protein